MNSFQGYYHNLASFNVETLLLIVNMCVQRSGLHELHFSNGILLFGILYLLSNECATTKKSILVYSSTILIAISVTHISYIQNAVCMVEI